MSQKHLSTALLEDVANRILRLDPVALDCLGQMDGKIICVQLKPRQQKPMTVYALPFAGGLRLRESSEEQPHVTLRGNIPFFLNLVAPGSDSAFRSDAKVEIEGDMDLGQSFKETLAGVYVDWEEQVSNILGDDVAHLAGNGFRVFLSWQRYARQRFSRNIREYQQDELGISPQPAGPGNIFPSLDQLEHLLGRLRQRFGNDNKS